MRVILVAALLASTATYAAGTRVDGYIRQDGTYVAPHYRSTPDSSRMNNYGTQGNYNPYTGQTGSVNPYTQPYPTPSPYNVQPNPYANPYGNPNRR